MSENKLLPCPFCGGEAIMQIVEPHTHVFSKFMVDCKGESFIECTKCTCSMSGETDKEVIDKWNRRKPMERIVKENEQLKNRCSVYTNGGLCFFCPLECKHRTGLFRGKVFKEEGGIE